MIKKWELRFNSKPRIVSGSMWNDPVLTLFGDDWGFNTLSSWRIMVGNQLVVGFDEQSAVDFLGDFVGQAVSAAVGLSGIDPVLKFENGLVLEIFVTHSVEPWTYRDSVDTIVGASTQG